MTTPCRARAHSNIALVKYWGKQDEGLNLPAGGSVSLTLDALHTTTSVQFDPSLNEDSFCLDGRSHDGKRVSAFLDLVRSLAKLDMRARVESSNNFPTASGLASSASAFAALALASCAAAKLELSDAALSALARRGSGSAARSIHGGFVEMQSPCGEGTHATPLYATDYWDVAMVVVVLGGGTAKEVGSTDGMLHTQKTSPFYSAWVAQVPRDIAAAKSALAQKDLDGLGQVMEASTWAMHGSAWAARPAVVYQLPETLAVLDEVRRLRSRGISAYATCDAGPHVKVLTSASASTTVAEALAGPNRELRICRPGPAATLIDPS